MNPLRDSGLFAFAGKEPLGSKAVLSIRRPEQLSKDGSNGRECRRDEAEKDDNYLQPSSLRNMHQRI